MMFAGQAKSGYYPTPFGVMENIRKIIRIQPGARVIDTCCGDGEALRQVTREARDVKTYGIELNTERAQAASFKLTDVICCDAIVEARASWNSFGMLWLNPPYDWAAGDTDQDKERLEVRFLKHHHYYLQDRGVLIYIVPFKILKKIAGFLANRLENLRVFPFLEMDYMKYEQAVVLGVYRQKGVSPEIKESNKDYLDHVLSVPHKEAPRRLPVVGREEFNAMRYEVPTSPVTDDEDITFRSIRFDPDHALRIIQKDGLYERFLKDTEARDLKSITTLSPLRIGHTAIALVSGYMNGPVRKDGKWYIVKGTVKKIEHVTDITESQSEKGGFLVKKTEMFRNKVRLFEFDARVFRDIG